MLSLTLACQRRKRRLNPSPPPLTPNPTTLQDEKSFRKSEQARLFGVLGPLWERTRMAEEEASAFKAEHVALTLATLEKIEVPSGFGGPGGIDLEG